MSCFNDQPRVNLGSLRQPASPFFHGPPDPLWRWPTGQHRAAGLMASAGLLLVGSCREVPTADHYELAGFTSTLLDLTSGTPLWSQTERIPLGLTSEHAFLLTDDEMFVEAYAEGELVYSRPLERLPVVITERGVLDWHELALPAGQVAYVREHSGVVAVGTWREEPQVNGEVTVFREGNPLWRGTLDCDVFPDQHGWFVRTLEKLESFDHSGVLVWQAPGASRVWIGPEWVVAQRSEQLVALNRREGTETLLSTGEPAWDVAVAGSSVWWLERQHQTLRGATIEGRKLHRGPQPGRLNRLLAWEGRLYGQEDDGSVISLKETPVTS